MPGLGRHGAEGEAVKRWSEMQHAEGVQPDADGRDVLAIVAAAAVAILLGRAFVVALVSLRLR